MVICSFTKISRDPPKIVETQGNFLYHLNLEIHRDHKKLIPGIKGNLCNQLLYLIEPNIQIYLYLIAFSKHFECIAFPSVDLHSS